MPTMKGNLPRSFEKRLSKHHFQANPPKIELLEDLSIVNSVLDREMKTKFKNSEERLLFRVEEWIKECTVPLAPSDAKLPVDDMPPSNDGSKKQKTEKNFYTRSLGRIMSRSLNNLDAFRSDHVSESNGEELKNQQAKSNDDLLKSEDAEVEQVAHKYGTLPRRKLKVPWFKNKDLVEETEKEQGKESKTYEKSAKRKAGYIAKRILHRKKKGVDENANDMAAKLSTAPSKVTKLRPSLFDMASLKTNAVVTADVEFEEGSENHDFEGAGQETVLGSDLIRRKFHTVTGIDVRDNHFKDSFRITHSTRQARNFVTTDTLFYSPEPKKADLGQI